VCLSCDARISSETLKIPEFASQYLTDESGAVLLCSDCIRNNVIGGQRSVATNTKSKGSASTKSAPSAASVSKSASPSSSQAPRSPKRPRGQPKRPLNSYSSLMDYCISHYYDGRSAGSSETPLIGLVSSSQPIKSDQNKGLACLERLEEVTPSTIKDLLRSRTSMVQSGYQLENRKARKPKTPKQRLDSLSRA